MRYAKIKAILLAILAPEVLHLLLGTMLCFLNTVYTYEWLFLQCKSFNLLQNLMVIGKVL